MNRKGQSYLNLSLNGILVNAQYELDVLQYISLVCVILTTSSLSLVFTGIKKSKNLMDVDQATLVAIEQAYLEGQKLLFILKFYVKSNKNNCLEDQYIQIRCCTSSESKIRYLENF